MVFYRKRNRHKSERLVTALLISLIFSPIFSQESDLAPEEDNGIAVEISPDKIIVGQRFDLTIFADFSAYRDVVINEPPLPDGISLVSGPYKSAQTIRVGDVTDPQYIKKTRVFYKYKVTKPGLFTLGSYSLTDGVSRYNTEPVMFPALAYDERELNYPVFARWSTIPDSIYVGETIPLILEMENLEVLSFPERITMDSPQGGMFERVNSVGEISVTSIGEDEVYIAPIESWLYTPTSSGTVSIPSATVLYGSIKRSTGKKTIEVLKTPAMVESSGAIGVFQVSTTLENLPLTKGGTSTLHVRVEGEGNLNYLRMPQPQFSGLTIIGKEELYSIEPSLSGYSGYREDVYKFSIEDNDNLSILFEDWNWLNKDQQSVETKILSDYQFQNIPANEEVLSIPLREQYPLLKPDRIIKYRDSVYNISWYYLLLLPGIVSVLAALVKKRHDMRLLGISLVFILCSSSAIETDQGFIEILEKADFYIEKGEINDALNLYSESNVSMGENPAVLYNMSLLNYDLDQKDKTILNLRKALVLKPGDRTFIGALALIEEEYGLDHQIASTTGLSPDLFFVLFILLFNICAVLIVFNIRKRRIELSILIIMIFFLSLFSLGIVFYTDYVSEKETAVIAHDGGQLKKVPGLGGGDWLTLLEGTAVSITSESDDSLLIRTGYGLEGWLDKKDLLYVHGVE